MATADCPALPVPVDLGPDFLTRAPAAPVDGVVIEVLVAEETGEANLGATPILAAFSLSGPLPPNDPELRAVAFAAGDSPSCAARVLVDADALESFKTTPLLVEVDFAGPKLSMGQTAEEPGLCTWLATDAPRSAAVECVAMPVTGSATITRARAWLRLSWSATTVGALPDWATTALGPLPTVPVGGQLALEPVPAEPFALTNPPFRVGSSIVVNAVAQGPGGWVAGGEYEPAGAGDERSAADAPVWFAPDGSAWRRVDSPVVFGGAGFQRIAKIISTSAGWWALGGEYTGSLGQDLRESSIMWRSTDGKAWRKLAIPCPSGGACPTGSEPILRSVADAPDGLIAAGGLQTGTPVALLLDEDGIARSLTELPTPAGVPVTDVSVLAATSGPRGFFILGQTPIYPNPGNPVSRALGWTSTDGRYWTLLVGSAGDSLAELTSPTNTLATPTGWVATGTGWVAWSADLSTWKVVVGAVGDERLWFRGLVLHAETVVALAEGDGQLAWSSRDGTTWEAIDLGAGPRPDRIRLRDGASDGSQLVVVGAVGDAGAAWISRP